MGGRGFEGVTTLPPGKFQSYTFINFNFLETLKDSPNTPPRLKFLEQRVLELVGGGGGGISRQLCLKRLRSRRGKLNYIISLKSSQFKPIESQ